MAFQSKNDYSGLTAISALSAAITIRDDNYSGSVEKYQPQGQDGSFAATEVYGEDASPTNSFGVAADISLGAGAVKLNSVTAVDSKKFALEQISITTAAGAAPTISTTAQLVEAAADDATQCHYSVPALTLKKVQHAQVLFGAFTLSGEGCTLTDCSATVAGSINKDKVAGVIIASDINSGVVTVSGTVLQTGSAAPTITAGEGFTVTQPLDCTNPETAYKSWSFELQKILTKDAAQSAQ